MIFSGISLRDGIIDDTQKAGEVILAESLRMTGLVESILMLSKMDSRSFPLHITEIQTDELLEQQVRILQNVLSNCIRYARETLSISAREEETLVRIIVEDDGPGIPQAELPYIFDRFYKGSSGQFGIGLSLPKSPVT